MHILEKNPIMFFIVMDINHYYSIITSQILDIFIIFAILNKVFN